MKYTAHKRLKFFAITLIIIGLAGLIPLNYFWLHSKIAVANHSNTVPTHPVELKPSDSLVSGQPVHITIPSLNIDLNITEGIYNPRSGQWTLSLDKAHFAQPSVIPNNQTGNTLIYGHYRSQVFATLHLIQPNDQAIITTDNGYKFYYTFVNSEATDPTDTSIFSYRGTPRLTIQTCSGSFMQNRQMYYFHYDSFSKL